jgi:tetratricopeptide (TPR) repeat protein
MEETQRPTTSKPTGTPHGPRGASTASQSYWWDTSSVPQASSIARSGSTASTILGTAVGPTQPQYNSATTGSMLLAVERVSEQCDVRGLQSTAVWLGELILSASPTLLEQTASHYPLIAASPSLDGASRSLASLGRQLFQNREYLRCHHLLKSAIPSSNASVATVEADQLARHQGGTGGNVAGTRGSMRGPMQQGGRSISSIRPSEGRGGDAWGATLDDEPNFYDGAAGSGHSNHPHGATPLHGQPTQSRPSGTHTSSLMMPDAWKPRLSGETGQGGRLSGASTIDHGASPIPPPLLMAQPQPSIAVAASTSAPAALRRSLESSAVVFLSLYALYMEGQRQRALAPIASRSQPNPNLRALRLLLQPALDRFPHDSYLLWLHAIVLRDSSLKQEAASLLIQAVRVNPFLWCAWQDLATLVTKESQLQDIANALRVHHHSPSGAASSSASGNNHQQQQVASPRPDSQLMFHIFAALVRGDLGYHTVAVVDWEELLVHFPTSSFIKCHIGTCLYNRKDFEAARCVFEEVREADPYRVEGTDEYSNVLFVRGDRVGLSKLAQQCYALDPYRAETNCILGNYYAMSGRHDKSLFYFKRAVTIDPLYLSGWTLMGHEYLEMKNTAAAVEAYRTAVEIDQRDYRAWYGLGQIYELLHMHHHALYYYWHTTTLRPTDPRMWSAVANCLDQSNRPHEAIACLERAEQYEPSVSEHYPQLVRRIAEYYLGEANSIAIGRRTARGAEAGPSAAARATTFLERLISCDRRKPDDLLFAIPALTEARLSDIHEAFNIPTRSPSFDPSLVHRNSGVGPRSSQGSAVGDANAVQDALATLQVCEQYLALLLRAVPISTSEGADNAPGDQTVEGSGHRQSVGAHHQQASVSQYVSQAQSGIQYVRSLLLQQPHAPRGH